jgi:phosphohistidine phosphatase
MKTLLILRHAKSSWSHDSLSDHDRPLNKRGERDAPRMGELILDRGLVPDLIISSTANRAHTTATVVAETCGFQHDIVFTEALYLSRLPTYQSILQQTSDIHQCVMVVGHNPEMEAMVEALTGRYQRMPTAALAQVTIGIESWSELELTGECDLTNLWRPRELQA